MLRTIYLSLDPYMRGRMDPGPHLAAPWLGNFGFSELEVVWRRLAAWAGGKENLPVDCRDPPSVRILGLSIHSLLSGIQTICLVLN